MQFDDRSLDTWRRLSSYLTSDLVNTYCCVLCLAVRKMKCYGWSEQDSRRLTYILCTGKRPEPGVETRAILLIFRATSPDLLSIDISERISSFSHVAN